MVAQGLEAEVKNLLAMGLTEKHQSMQGIGYKEMISHIHGHCSLDEAVSAIKQASRNYAKTVDLVSQRSLCGGVEPGRPVG